MMTTIITDAYYRHSDIVFEWDKILSSRPGSAIKSLVTTAALIHPDHPLRSKSQAGVEFYLGMFQDKKARLLFSYKQVQYLRYYVCAIGFARSLEGGNDEDEEQEMEEVGLPSSLQFVFENQMIKVLPVILDTQEKIKAAIRNPTKMFKQIEDGSFNGEYLKNVKDVVVDAEGDSSDSKEVISVVDYEGIEVGPSVIRSPCPLTTFTHAEQAYIICTQGGQIPTYASKAVATGRYDTVAGRGLFLSVDFESWELELGVILDFGWAACWWESIGSKGDWKEMLDQAHWIVDEHQQYAKETASDRQRMPYLYGDSEVMPLEEFRRRVGSLISDMQAKLGENGGPIYLVIHSTDRSLDTLSLLDLPYETFHNEMQPEGFLSPAYATRRGIGEVFVLDMAQMVAAMEQGKGNKEDEDVKLTTQLTLQDTVDIVCRDYPEPLIGFGNSGNDAWLMLECFLVLVTKKFEMAKTDFVLAQSTEDEDGPNLRLRREEEELANNPVDFSFDALRCEIGSDGPEADSDFDPRDVE